MRLSIEDMQAPEFLKDRYTQFELLGAGGMRVLCSTSHTLADMPSLETICLNHRPGTTNDGASYLQSAHNLKFKKFVDLQLTASEEVERVGAPLGKGGADSSEQGPLANREEGYLTTGSKSNSE